MATQNAMNHGPFYRSPELVAGVHKAEGCFAGFRAAHAYARIYAGAFAATPVAKTLSRAAHFQGTPLPVTARLSGASGDPNQKPSNVLAMATKFYLLDGTVTDLIGITFPAFFVRTPEEFLAFTEAHTADPATGEPNLAKLKAFAAAHPDGGRLAGSIPSDCEVPYYLDDLKSGSRLRVSTTASMHSMTTASAAMRRVRSLAVRSPARRSCPNAHGSRFNVRQWIGHQRFGNRGTQSVRTTGGSRCCASPRLRRFTWFSRRST